MVDVVRDVPVLDVRDIGVTYGRGSDAFEAIRSISLTVRRGEFVSVVGPSGCGKTTLLKTIAGLLGPTRGEALVEGRKVIGPPGDLALVFQEYTRSLMPWLSVIRNVSFPLSGKGIPRSEQRQRARAALAEVGLIGFEDRYPWQLSGGMQQRVAIARAIAFRPAVLLMDEPFASVDAQTRADLEDLMLRVHADTGVTIVFVTHDIDESIYLGERVLVLSKSPTTIRAVLDVPIPQPRDQLTTRALPEFLRLRSEILSMIRVKGQEEAPPSDQDVRTTSTPPASSRATSSR